MKRLFLLFFSALLCTAVSAHDFEVDGIYYNITSSSDLTVSVTYRGYSSYEYSNEYSGSVVIPEKVTYDSKEYSVTSIGEDAFYECSGLMSVTIPNSVTFIGFQAFYGTGWYNEHSNGILYLDSWLIGYKGDEPTGTLEIKEGTRGIANNAFAYCSGLTSVTIPNSVTSIGESVFESCSGLTSVTIPNSATTIGNYAFRGCSGLTSVTIPNSVTNIGSSAFSGCSGLTSVTIPNSVTSIGSSAFSGCSGELTVNCNIPSASSYTNGVFYGSKFTSVIIGDKVTSIGSYAFYGCKNLTSVTIGNSVTSIGQFAFSNCSGELTVNCNIPSASSYTYGVFYGSKFTSVIIGDKVTSIGSWAFSYCSGLTSVTIPNSVTSIGYHAFRGCSGLTSVTIPNSVTSIGESAFLDCYGLTAVHISDLSAWCKIEFDSSGSNPTYYAHHLYLNGEEIINLVIPDDVTSIGGYAFWKCSGLINVDIPNSVTSIGEYAFWNCSGLTSVTIPNSVTSIGYHAFEGCSGLKSLRFEDGESTLTFSDNFSNTIDSLHLGRNITSKSSYFNTGENNLSILSIGKHVISLDDKMFYNCSNITKVICYATEPPMIYPMTFYTDIYGKATLSVLGESMEKYRNADVWKKFSKIEEIDNNPNATEQCAAPVITYADGKLQFACETAGAECKYTLTAKDIQTAFITANNNSVDLTACYDITAYAVAEGYKNSEKVTATLYWINGSDVSTNINQTEMRGVMTTCSGGIITVSGLSDGETVMFYDANGALLYTGTAQNGTISYAPSASGVIIVKIGTASIKVVN